MAKSNAKKWIAGSSSSNEVLCANINKGFYTIANQGAITFFFVVE